MLDADLTTQLRNYLERLEQPIELVASLDEGEASTQLYGLLAQIATLSPEVTFNPHGTAPRRPSFDVRRPGADVGITFAAIPLGHEFTSLVLALLQVGGYPPRIAPDLITQVRDLEGEFHFETYISLSCHSCPDTVQALNLMSVLNPNIHHTAIDGALYPAEVAERSILSVPTVYLNGQPFDAGRMSVEHILAKLDAKAPSRQAHCFDAKPIFDMLVVGGGPAGASAAIYAARKGIHTGMVAERFGGQVLDTLAIENLISVPYTEGPQLANALESHVRQYQVDLMNHQRIEALLPAVAPGEPVGVRLANGATLRAKVLVLAPGARWRAMGVPGEDAYRTKGVTYCPHCDGPLFKGKHVAVIGGGNSGIEAAIDLAGIVAHVTVLEFDTALRADAVLQRKLASLPNVTVLTHVQTTEVYGDGKTVRGLAYTARTTGQVHRLALSGVFVQIGLLPNTEWLQGAIELTGHGEIAVDSRGQTSEPGVFAAGDATTSPFKQIVTAMGDGAKAALGAFEYLIRLPVLPAEASVAWAA